MTKNEPSAFGEIRVTLPKFLITALRQFTKDANTKDGDPRWTVSQLLESFLFRALTSEELEEVATKSPEFKREAEAWLRWTVSRRPERRYRK